MPTSPTAPAAALAALLPYFGNIRFRKYEKPQTSTKAPFMGYVNCTLILPGALPNSDLQLELFGFEIKVVNGKPMLGFPQELRDGKRYDTYRPANAETREVLTASMFSDPQIAACVEPFLHDVVIEEDSSSETELRATIAAQAQQMSTLASQVEALLAKQETPA